MSKKDTVTGGQVSRFLETFPTFKKQNQQDSKRQCSLRSTIAQEAHCEHGESHGYPGVQQADGEPLAEDLDN